MKRPRRKRAWPFKAKVVLAALRGEQTLAELAQEQEYDVDANRIVQWKTQLEEHAMDLFVTAAERKASGSPSVKDLHAKIGQLAMENDFLADAVGRIPEASAKG